MIYDPLRVLVADDEMAIATSLRDIFRQAGLNAEAVFGGDDAVELAKTFRPDVVVMDYDMLPGIDGLQASAAIKRLLPATRVIVLSAKQTAIPAQPYIDAGYEFLLVSKPIHPKGLLSVVRDDAAYMTPSRIANVLNVDDVEPNRYSITRLLSRAGFSVSEAATGMETVKRTVSEHPDFILLDIHLPDTDGFEVCKELKSNPATSDISIVHLTATAKSSGAMARSRTVGADANLTQPIEPAFLISRLRDVLQSKFLRP